MDDQLTGRLDEHARCVRSVALALLRNDADAEDVTQDALVAAARAEAPVASWRAWLARVGRHLALRRRRTDARRFARERAAARRETQESAADDAERAELLQALATAIAALPQPLREVVLLRHYDDLPPRRIAAALGISVEAVETRLRRARERLRSALRAHAPGRDLRALLVPFAVPGAWIPVAGAATVSLKSKSPFAAALLVLLVATAVLVVPRLGAPPAATEPTPAVAAVREEAAEARADLAVRAASSGPAAATVEAIETPPTWTARIRGRVVDDRRFPVAGASIVVDTRQDARATARSAADGSFAIDLPLVRTWTCDGEVAAVHEGRIGGAVFQQWQVSGADVDVGTIALQAAGALRVRVHRGGTPVEDARVVAMQALYRPALRHEAGSDERGEAALPTLAPDRYCVAATAPDGTWIVGHADVLAGRATTVDLDLNAAVPVEVFVRTHDGESIEGASIEVLLRVTSGFPNSHVPLGRLVALPRTHQNGRAVVSGLTIGANARFLATHPDFVCDTQHPSAWLPPIDWSARVPQVEVVLESPAWVTWQLVPGEVDVPPDGTVFEIHDARAVLRARTLRYRGRTTATAVLNAVGPGCCARLEVPKPGETTDPGIVNRCRRLEVELCDPGGRPLRGWPLMLYGQGESQLRTTDADGKVVTTFASAGRVEVAVQSAEVRRIQVGTADLSRGEARLTGTYGPPRRVRARVTIDGEPGLPGAFTLRATRAHIDRLEEDPATGTLSFDLWCAGTTESCVVTLVPAAQDLPNTWTTVEPGEGVTEVALRIVRKEVVPVAFYVAWPARFASHVLLERYEGGSWNRVMNLPPPLAPEPELLPPGRYRLREERSERVSDEVEVRAGTEPVLQLDLSNVVTVVGSVAARAPLDGVAVEVRDPAGATVRRVPLRGDGGFVFAIALDRPDLTLVAVRGDARSVPVPLSAGMTDVQLVLPD